MHSWITTSDNEPMNDSLRTSFVVVKRRDVRIETIVFPDKNLYKEYLYKPVIEIKNDGLEDLEGVNLSSEVFVSGISIYSKNQVLDIASGQSLKVNFDSSLTYNQLAEAQAIFIVDVNDDQVRTNDTMITTFNFIRGLGVTDYAQPEVVVYPNPFENYINITAENPISSIRLIDLFGRVIFEGNNLNLFNTKFDIDVQKGLYILEVCSGDQWYKVPITRD
jgi:hypothetical protein